MGKIKPFFWKNRYKITKNICKITTTNDS